MFEFVQKKKITWFTIDHFQRIARLRGIKQKKLNIHSSTSMRFLFLESLKVGTMAY